MNDVVRAAKQPTDELARLLRKAVWMGAGVAPSRRTPPPVDRRTEPDAPPAVESGTGTDHDDSFAAVPTALPVEPVTAEPVAVVSPAAGLVEGPPVTIDDRELVVMFGERRWRVRGLHKVSSFDLLRVNVLVGVGDRFHVDTLDLYSARARQAFTLTAAAELALDEGW